MFHLVSYILGALCGFFPFKVYTLLLCSVNLYLLVTDVSINCKIGSVSLFVCMLLLWLSVGNLSLSCIISSAPVAF